MEIPGLYYSVTYRRGDDFVCCPQDSGRLYTYYITLHEVHAREPICMYYKTTYYR
jgi:hypothetical protein